MNQNLPEKIGKIIGHPIETVCKFIEALLGKTFEVTGELIAIDAYSINGIDIRGPGKPPWAKGPKPTD